MPRVKKQIARKDIYRTGLRIPDSTNKSGFRYDRSIPADENDTVIVQKGQEYYKWKFRYGSPQISLTYPKPQQLTQSDFLTQCYDIQESIDVIDGDSPDDLQGAKDIILEEIQNLLEETDEKFNNMPDSLQQGPVGELLQQRVNNLQEAIDALEGVELDFDEEGETSLEDWLEEKKEELRQVCLQIE
jgi:hypothetical protein